MHRLTTTFVLGYHGCDESVAARLIAGDERFAQSHNDYDWLGGGVYFWEANPRRGMEFAHQVRERLGSASPIASPAVVGAIIDLRLCLDLSTSAGAGEVEEAYRSFEATVETAGK